MYLWGLLSGLVGAGHDLVAAKHRDTRLGFARLLKFAGPFGRLPRGRAELHPDAVEYVAKQLGIDVGSLGFYGWTGRTIERPRGDPHTHTWVPGVHGRGRGEVDGLVGRRSIRRGVGDHSSGSPCGRQVVVADGRVAVWWRSRPINT